MMNRAKLNVRRVVFAITAAFMISVSATPPMAFAAIIDGRGTFGECGQQMMRTYFADVCGTTYTDVNGDKGFVMPRRDVSGILRPALYGIDTKQELYDYLVGSTGLGSGSEQARVGAAFIIHTMLGRSGDQANDNGGKTISAADRTALYQSLVLNPGVTLSLDTHSNQYNSGSRVVNGVIDESFFNEDIGGTVTNVDSVLLKNSSGTILYALEVLCANPMGGRPGLPAFPSGAPNLNPGISMSPSTIIQVGSTATVTFSVTETNGISNGVADYTRRVWIENGSDTTYNAGDQSLNNPSGSNITYPAGTTTNSTFTTGAITGGNRLCATFQLTGKSTLAGMTTISGSNPEVLCVPIGKYPKMQVQYGDVWVGGGLSGAACTTIAGQDFIYGAPNNGSPDSSFASYGVTAVGNITQFGSAGWGLQGLHAPSVTPETLTFASGGAFNGLYLDDLASSPVNCLTDPASEYPIPVTAGSATIGAQSLGAGSAFERHYTGTVTISGNITYANTAYPFGTFPRLVIIADGDIIINPNVTQIDGIYIAKGKIYTCGSTNAATNVRRGAACDTTLTVNGSLFAGGRLIPWRAGGAVAPDVLQKAELINLRPDTYYSECQRVCDSGMRTVTQQEMPVRF